MGTHCGYTIKPSAVGGLGYFVAKDIPVGNVIGSIEGSVITYAEIEARVQKGQTLPDSPLQIGGDVYIDPIPPSLYFNHSCGPNAALRSFGELVAIRPIVAGDEITFDYSTSVSSWSRWTMSGDCQCGATRCRSVIGNWKTAPKEAINTLYSQNLLLAYIRTEIERLQLLESAI